MNGKKTGDKLKKYRLQKAGSWGGGWGGRAKGKNKEKQVQVQGRKLGTVLIASTSAVYPSHAPIWSPQKVLHPRMYLFNKGKKPQEAFNPSGG